MTNTERIQAHNELLRECIEIADDLPDAGGATTDPIIEPLEVTENGTYVAPVGVDGYSPVTVNIPIPDGYIVPSGTLEVTENGQHDVAEYASVNVNVPAGGGGSVIDFLAETLTEVIDTEGVVKSISAYLFDERSMLKTVRLPAVTSIGAYNFRNCGSLVTLDLPELTGSTGTYFAASCPYLVNVNIPKATTLGQYSMRYCNVLEFVDLPSVESIVNYCLTGCTKLHTLILRSTKGVVSCGGTSVISASAIAKGNGYIYVPADLIEAYKVATNWTTFATQFRALEDYTVDGTTTGELDESKI